MYSLAAYLFASSLVVTLLLMPLCMKLARRLSVLDLPGPRKIHTEPTPLCGGWAIFGTMTVLIWGHLLAALLVRSWSLKSQLPALTHQFLDELPSLILKILPVYAGAVAVFILGLIDDVRGMSVRSRFWIQVLLAAGLSATGLAPNLGFLPEWVTFLLGVVWIVGITNAFNFLDGLDGLSAGVALVGTSALLTIMGLDEQPDWCFFLAVQAGALIAFLRHNWYPARVFLGSSGSLLIGYLLGVSTLMVTYSHGAAENPLMPLLTPVFILAIPIYDTISVVLIRLFQKRHIAIGDQSHFHHRLTRLGFSHRQTVAFIILLSFSIALSGVRLVDATVRQSLVIFTQILALVCILILAERVAGKVRKDMLERQKDLKREPTETGV